MQLIFPDLGDITSGTVVRFEYRSDRRYQIGRKMRAVATLPDGSVRVTRWTADNDGRGMITWTEV